MSKFNKIMTVVFIAATLLIASTVVASAATGENVITIIKEYIETHVFFIDGEEVSEDEFNAFATGEHTEVVEKEIRHELFTETVYKINGAIVSKEEYEAKVNSETSEITPITPAKKETDNSVTEITFTGTSLTPLNIGSLGDYLIFETDGSDKQNVTKICIKSSAVKAVKYDFTGTNYLAFATYTENGYYMYPSSYCSVSQKSDITGYHFTMDTCNSTTYVCGTDGTNTISVTEGACILYFENNPSYASLELDDFFSSITLILE